MVGIPIPRTFPTPRMMRIAWILGGGFILTFLTAFLVSYGPDTNSRLSDLSIQTDHLPDVYAEASVGMDRHTATRHRVLILQHDCGCDWRGEGVTLEIAKHSVEQHARYARAHGYGYKVSGAGYVPGDVEVRHRRRRRDRGFKRERGIGGEDTGVKGDDQIEGRDEEVEDEEDEEEEKWGGTQYMNKVWLALQTVLEEIEKGPDGAEWIFLTDVDTLIADPSIPLHLLLPPSGLHPRPLVLGSQDHNGFNNGVILYRVSHRLASFLARVLTLEYHTVEPSSSVAVQPELAPKGQGLKDQRALGLGFKNYRDAAAGFYEIPRDCFNSYRWSTVQRNSSDLPGGGVRMQMHLAGDDKPLMPWEEEVEAERMRWEELRRAGQEYGLENGSDDEEGQEGWMEEVVRRLGVEQRVKEAGRKWWDGATGGTDGVFFPDF